MLMDISFRGYDIIIGKKEFINGLKRVGPG
jgi:hypothetical protein